uniref:Uncharacterized protein n=1 Tax=Romanomermis culicivorax TaxID=13658 RepID=A0A915J3L2_ROMCU
MLKLLGPTSYICHESGMIPMLTLNNSKNAPIRFCQGRS